jgi:outer membrane receptor protein involved in Fe transport
MTASLTRARRGLFLLGCVALLAGASGAWAQTTGTLVGAVTDGSSGKPVAGALVIATSPSLQGEQTAVADRDGHYTITLLPPGRYKVAAQVQGYQPAERDDLVLRIDYTLRANLALTPEAVELEPQVIRTRVAPVVNVGNAEEGGVISREFLATVPTTRGYEGTVIITATAVRDLGGISLGGATSPENNYILDGLRVGDPSANYLGSNLLTNFIDQIDVKTGGFMPEYGYSSGGIVNTVTKSGSNEFHGSIWGNLTPGLFTPASEAVGRNGEAIASYASPYKGSYDTDFGLEVGGPILKDRLWFYAGLAAQMTYDVRTGYYRSRIPSATNSNVAQRDPYGLFVMQQIPGSDFTYGSGRSTLYAVAKLTWLVSENHNLFASFNTQPSGASGKGGVNGTPAATYFSSTSNVTNAVVGYGGKLLDKHLLLEANLGWYASPFVPKPGTVNGVDQATTPGIGWATLQPLQNFDPALAASCPYESRQVGIGLAPGCYVQNYATGGLGGYEESTTQRFSGTASASVLFDLAGQHVLKGGVQIDFAEYNGTQGIYGGSAWTAFGRFLGPGVPGTGGSFNAFSMTTYGQVDPASALPGRVPTVYANWCSSFANGTCVNPGGKDPSLSPTNSILSHNWSNGFYLQDSWTIANVLTLGVGVRLDTQVMTNASPTNPPFTPQLDIQNSWAPRVQAIWDFTGQGRGKVQANWGRYYESVPLTMAFVSLATTPSCTADMIPGQTSTGNPAVSCPNVYGLPAGSGPGPNTRTLGASPLAGAGFTAYAPYFAPLAPGLDGQYTDQFGGGIQYEILQDLSVGVDYIGRRQGKVIEDMSSDNGINYFVANPGGSQPWTVTEGPYAGTTFNPLNGAGLDTTTGNVYTATFGTPVRSYDAVTLSVAKLFSKRWLAQASYTWSSLRGNYSGLIRTDAAQLMPNQLKEFDLISNLGNRTGPLGSNRTNQVKAAGSYLLDLGQEVSLTPGVQLSAISGRPTNTFGNHVFNGDNDVFLLPRGMAGDLPWQVSLDVSGKLTWAISGPYTLTFTLSIFNVLNSQATTGVDQRYTLDFVSPIQGAQCGARNSVTQKDPLAAITTNCPDLAYARTFDGRRVTPNLNYGRPGAYQTPISARFGVALSF